MWEIWIPLQCCANDLIWLFMRHNSIKLHLMIGNWPAMAVGHELSWCRSAGGKEVTELNAVILVEMKRFLWWLLCLSKMVSESVHFLGLNWCSPIKNVRKRFFFLLHWVGLMWYCIGDELTPLILFPNEICI